MSERAGAGERARERAGRREGESGPARERERAGAGERARERAGRRGGGEGGKSERTAAFDFVERVDVVDPNPAADARRDPRENFHDDLPDIGVIAGTGARGRAGSGVEESSGVVQPHEQDLLVAWIAHREQEDTRAGKRAHQYQQVAELNELLLDRISCGAHTHASAA